MKNAPPSELAAALDELSTLLGGCGEPEKAAWIEERRAGLAGASEAARRQEVLAVRKILAGMGSLSDLYLEPTADCGLTSREAEERQRELLHRLDVLTGGSERAPTAPRMLRVGQSSKDL